LRIREKTVEELVQEASLKMSDPNYSAVLVGTFVQTQAPAAQYISAHEEELGGAEIIVNLIFHAALIGQCFQRTNNRSVQTITYEDLNHVAAEADEVRDRLKREQPAVAAYIEQNADGDAMKRILTLLAVTMEWVS